jgi:hypothetical protein
MRRTPIPTLEEIPATPDGYMRALDDLLPLILIPTDDAGLRSLVVKMFNLSEQDCNEGTPEGGKSSNDSYKQMLLDLSSTPARTPGGLAASLGNAGWCSISSKTRKHGSGGGIF